MSKKIEIYDPAMCCDTGVCGPSVDTELLRVATLVENLKKQGVDVTRFNLANEPQAFIENKIVNELLMQDADILPVTLVDGEVVKTKKHLTNDEFSKYSGVLIMTLPTESPAAACCTPAEGEACCGNDAQEQANEGACCCGGDTNCC